MDIKMDANNNKSFNSEKCYSLRPRSGIIIHRRCSDDEEEERPPVRIVRRGSKSKRKAAPLSKYRRKNANARERTRMREINEAFETLRRAVPYQDEKMTKIATLKLAMSYIAALSDVLSESSDADSLISDSTSSTSAEMTSPPLTSFSLLDSQLTSDFYTDSLSLDPYDNYDDFGFDLEDSFPPDLVS
uniref:Taxi A n=1 Tax=Microvelia americana TaxID=1187971 RepID=A0A4Q8KF50_9HEMI|nr:taxi A [Microvelia americana]